VEEMKNGSCVINNPQVTFSSRRNSGGILESRPLQDLDQRNSRFYLWRGRRYEDGRRNRNDSLVEVPWRERGIFLWSPIDTDGLERRERGLPGAPEATAPFDEWWFSDNLSSSSMFFNTYQLCFGGY